MLALALRVVALLTSLQEMPSNVYKMQENARRPGLRLGPPAPDPDGGAYSAPPDL